MTHTNKSAFTLVELLVTVAILGVLAALSAFGYQAARDRARAAIEVGAARNLIAGYLIHSTDHNGRVMPGYRADPYAQNLDGKPLQFPLNARYPWRLAPYLGSIEGVMLYNGNESALDTPNADYLVSVQSNMGLNAVLVGGHFGTGSPLPPSDRLIERLGKFHLTHLAEANSPEKLIVFASARSEQSGRGAGYFEVRPPNLLSPVWSSDAFSSELPPSAHGFVDFRWRGKAAVANLGGNVELLDESQLRDMRRWSIQAAAENAPDFHIRQR
jgi:prepilin-type N-terminal cleavage/methylation domain-containing protein